ncbi:MAG TPA: NAD-dependent epimerase/dehydratase family protein [Solirubrobacterales bacterium]|jgi:nucleoside-diphosphate-sugar epimerase|nr:NAD-dependent epimerase/dehydratase family protein [Solirubrobacterales bacterium]
MAETAFVTGGSGFIGGKLVSRLVGEGRPVRALARSDKAAAAVESLGAEAVRGELGDRASLAAGAAGATVAFHLAAHLGEYGPWEDFERGNVEGTRNVLAACAEAGVKRFVHCGTEAALMAGDPLVQVDETAPLRPDSSAPYPATKAKAELAVRDANRDGFETVALRPRFVWGEGDTTLLPEMVETVKAGQWAWVGGGRNVTDTAHVDNVVEGLILAAEKGKPGESYFVTDGEPLIFREFVTAMLQTQGVEPPGRSLPAWTAAPMARICETAWKFLPLPGEPPMTTFRSWLLTQECTIDIAKARKELGYAPIVSHEQGLAAMRAA